MRPKAICTVVRIIGNREVSGQDKTDMYEVH